MKKGMKKVLIGLAAAVGVIVIAIAIAVVVIFSNLDGIVRVGTEKAMTYVLKVDVTVDGAHVDTGAGSISLTGVNIPNPEGYKTPHAMKFGEVFVEADISSFRSDTPTIRLIRISEPDIIYDRKVKTSNIDDLLDNASSADEEQQEEPEEAPEEAQKQLVIEQVVVEGSTIQVGLPFSEGKTVKTQVPDIVINDIGKEDDRVTPAEAMETILKEMLTAFAGVGADTLKAGEEAVGKAADETMEQVDKATGGVKDAIGGLLGGNKDEEEE